MAGVSLLIFLDYTIRRASSAPEAPISLRLMRQLKYLMFIINLLLTRVKWHGILTAEKTGRQ
jgi:hypothetical protein